MPELNTATSSIKRPTPDAQALHRQRELEYAKISRRVSKAKQLSDRDYDLLRRVGTGHVLSLEQARQIFWKKDDGQLAALTTAQYRLAQLVGSGYLKTDYTNVRRPGEQIYCLTPKGAALLTPLERSQMTLDMPNHKEMKQQLDGQDTRIKLEQRLAEQGERLLHWKSERQVRSEAMSERSRHQAEQQRASTPKNRLHNLKQYRPKQENIDAQAVNVGDAQAVIERADGSLYTLDIEIDGKYFGKMLKQKIVDMKELSQKSGTPLIWATSGRERAARIGQEVSAAGAANHITVIDVSA